ncbi:MAG: methylglyoxal synthase [bacterium]|nr:methylglyoxal synthase [bacterium]
MSGENHERTLIGILANHDSKRKNQQLAKALDHAFDKYADLMEDFHFLVTGGTYERIVSPRARSTMRIKADTRKKLLKRTTVLPPRQEGGVTILSYFVVRRLCQIVWPFLDPETAHWLIPENLALMRLCDQCRAKRLMNSGSVREWLKYEAPIDRGRRPVPVPPNLVLYSEHPPIEIPSVTPDNVATRMARPKGVVYPDRFDRKTMTIALIAHDEMKGRMVDFAVDHESELLKFKRILATGTTGREVANATIQLEDRLRLYHSGPKGGDIEIATEMLMDKCQVVVFFVDPLRPHPHIEDIRVVFAACMIHEQVRMLTNELQAREWMGRVARKGDA